MKKSILFILFLSYNLNSYSQLVNMILKYPQSVQFVSTDALNLDVLNNTKSFKCRFNFIISNSRLGPVVEINSESITLPSGISSFTSQNLRIQNLKYLNKDIANLERNLNSLPSGNYSICVKLICMDDFCRTISPENEQIVCIEAPIEDVSPLLLNYPQDKDSIDEKTPFFTWIPPMPIGSSPDINYSIGLYSMKENQSSVEAISRNRAIFEETGIKNTSLPFPIGIDPLLEGNKYAWYVEARVNSLHIATSEVWEFKVKKPLVKPIDTVKFAQLLIKPDAGYVSISQKGILYFIHKGDYINEELSVTLTTDLGKKVNLKPGKLIKADISRPNDNTYILSSFGPNKYELDFSNHNLTPGFYMLNVNTANSQKLYLRINIISN